VAVVHNLVLHRLERNVNDVLYLVEALVRSYFACCLLQVESQCLDAPFAAVLVVVEWIQF
jgi:hypothetical protein